MAVRILTVEDDERIQAAMRLALEDEGYTVVEAASGEEGLESFARRPADVVLIDLMLPGIDGFEVCRSIRRSSDVPIVMVTARSDTHDVVAGLEAGEVLVAGQLIPLTKTEFRLLCELAGSPGRVFSREQLLERVWGYDYFGDGRLVDVHVRRLRTKVEADPAHPRYVVTSRGLGYKLQT